MTTAAQVIARADRDAAAETGTTEQPAFSNCSSYGSWYVSMGAGPEYRCAAYCAMALSQWFYECGLPLPVTVPWGGAYVPSFMQWFQNQGRWRDRDAELFGGEVAVLNFGSGGGRHIELVRASALPGQPVATIGANTSSSDAGSQDNGGGVFRRLRGRSNILGYGIPNYSESSNQNGEDGDERS